MSDQRIDTGAEAATSTAADPGEGQGAADPGAQADPIDPQRRRTSGGDAEMPQPTPDRPGAAPAAGGADTADTEDIEDTADTEGAAALRDAHRAADQQQRGEPDLGGRQPAGDGSTRRPLAPGSGAATERPARAETGEVSAAPSPERRAEDPGSVATEFGDRADSAPEDDIAHPSI